MYGTNDAVKQAYDTAQHPKDDLLHSAGLETSVARQDHGDL